jgi:hypothetical protein
VGEKEMMMTNYQQLTQKALGIGLLRVPTFPRGSSALLIVAGIGFVMAQAGGIAITFFYPLATIAWLIALAPLGWRYLRGKAVGRAIATEAATT